MSYKIDPKWPTAVRAEEDIICYKPLIPSTRNGCYYSNIRHFPYELGYMYKETDFGRKRQGFIVFPGLCSFESLEAARRAVGIWKDCAYVQCVIPEGAFYFHNNVEGSHLSDILILEEEVDTDDCPAIMTYAAELFTNVGQWIH